MRKRRSMSRKTFVNRILLTGIGVFLIVLGIPMLILPGPGVACIGFGLYCVARGLGLVVRRDRGEGCRAPRKLPGQSARPPELP